MAVLNKDLPFQTSIGLVGDDEAFYHQGGHTYTRFEVWLNGPAEVEPEVEVEIEPEVEPEVKVKTVKIKKAKAAVEPAEDDQDLI